MANINKYMALHRIIFITLLLSVITEANRMHRNRTVEFLKDLQANQLSSFKTPSQFTEELQDFDFDVHENELPGFQMQINEWIWNQVKGR